MAKLGGAPKCPTCDKSVFFAEEVRAVGKAYHKLCLKCSECNKILDSTSVNDHDGTLFCRNCYAKNFSIKGYGFAGGAAGLFSEAGNNNSRSPNGRPMSSSTSSSTSPTALTSSPIASRFGGGGDLCARCQKTVYANEKTDCAGLVYHKLCFKCEQCNKLLEKGSSNEHSSHIYCKGCYNKLYGTKGFVAGTSMHVS